jgi:hypothetical protein
MNKYISRLTSSSRGEVFNKLAWLFLFPTFFVGLAFVVGIPLGLGGTSQAMATALNGLVPHGATIWGSLAMANIILGTTFLLIRFPPFGKTAGLIGFMLWLWAGIAFAMEGLGLLTFVICIPQGLFWIWQYLALSRFKAEDALDKKTMEDYDSGGYDDELNPKDSKIDREDNRGKDVQFEGSYEAKDEGTDLSRPLDSDN